MKKLITEATVRENMNKSRPSMKNAKKGNSRKGDGLWAEGSFIESSSQEDWELKKRTFHMKHDEEMEYDCVECGKKISAHNKDWHAGMCDDCFNKKYFND